MCRRILGWTVIIVAAIYLLPTPEAFAQSTNLVFPQFAAGPGLSSTITLINADGFDASATVQIFNEDGTNAKDLPDGTSFTIPANGLHVLNITSNTSVHVGSVNILVQSDSVFSAPVFGSLVINIAGIGSSAVQQGQIGNQFVVPVQRAALRTGIAMANVCPFPATGMLTLRSADGLSVIGTQSLQFKANGHVAKFIDELVTIPGSAAFTGVAMIMAGPTSGSCVSTLAVSAYDLGSNLGQFVVLPVGLVN